MRLRGRKGIREALEEQPELVILEPKQYKGHWAEFFGNTNPIHVELGMGKGKFISELSLKHPHMNFIGIDMYDELLRRASEKARDIREAEEAGAGEKLMNLALVLVNIENIEDVFEESEIERIYLNFSDPWPKKRHAKRRLTHSHFLQKYSRILNERGQIHFKTDSRSLFEFSLNSFSDMGLRMRDISLHLHESGIRKDMVQTEYELKFFEKGMPIYRCEVLIGSDALEEHEVLLKDQVE